ncbi:MAG TPA: archaeosortase/exosortase family protein [Candidatus Hydrogenedentes bacterium]|nr:archaeosortase/exosortase family protein [Candidatus Hydrogenedentota bacterium]HPG67434.1 archaeosortase/exosortase family protein [Candidatus Hydrogenedentota bacterium]
MTDQKQPPRPEAADAEDTSQEEKRQARKRVTLFVLVFMVCVFSLLTSYRFVIDTIGNDWYLYQVARHTAWILRWVGEAATIESTGQYDDHPDLYRARLAAWARGEEIPEAADPPAVPGPPLTPWEAWRYRVLEMRHGTEKPDETGPLVRFTLKHGIATRIREKRAALEELQGDARLDEREKAQRAAEIQKEVDALKEEYDQGRREQRPSGDLQGMTFAFTVVPDCGAIPSMSIFLAAVVAFPTRWWKRVIGVVAGLPILYFVNCGRLACLATIGAWDYGQGHAGKYFNFAHHYVWQGIYIVFVVAVWMIWVEYVVRGNEQWENQGGSEA